ncbi:heme ABC transporter ATP-binding protein [Deinococcus maricopensis]|uniref:Iron-chelate-transporting ATPase n=1 Tax=Deinococcus maricopensis (strain DSM 21211 / LMG 22137 / NRRL B-23946 / LB-34) TaxID=709986 RepID=E8U468_DEIML|nr:heme ABC transporter ATP-binding protein [Deinococcus maricopensis]ADV65905.1 Iron-chelate-transporting ATPase [Deinococcus maricopensis DSM 21211]
MTPAHATPSIDVHALHATIAGRTLLEDITFSVQAGELLAIVGRNGAGKSTLLKHLTGELRARGVQLFGLPLERHAPARLARQRAVLPQNTPLTFAYDVLDVVLLGRLPHGRGETPADRDIARACLDRVGLSGFEGRNILTLSGGEQQRVHLARVLAQLHGTPGPRALLLDEPTSALDLAHQHAALRTALSLCDEGVAVIAVLHDLNLAAQYARRVLMLDAGRVRAWGTPHDVLTPAHIQAAFGHPVLVTPHPCLQCPLIISAS